MARHLLSWLIRKTPPLRALRFAGLVGAVAVFVFYLTMNGRFSDAVPLSTPVGATANATIGESRGGDLTCVVAAIIDGDTLRCLDGTRIRLHAVAARERDGSCSPGHPCPSASAQAATTELRRLAGGRTLRCHSTGNSYGRITAICWTREGTEINCAMVRSGVALIWDRFNRESPLCRG